MNINEYDTGEVVLKLNGAAMMALVEGFVGVLDRTVQDHSMRFDWQIAGVSH